VLTVLERRLGAPGQPAGPAVEAGRPTPAPFVAPVDLLMGVPLVHPDPGASVWKTDGSPQWPPSPAVHAEYEQRRAALAAFEAEVVDEPGEPPVGSVVTDTRMRACWRSEDGWHRADTDAVLSWAQIRQAVGGPEAQPLPGDPMIVSQPPPRHQGPMVTRPPVEFELPVQHAVLDDEGKPLLGPNGAPLLKTEMETMAFSEVVPADGRP
jgi:hypothetical protein